MYLFARTRTIAPAHGREAIAAAVEAGAKAGEITGLKIFVWTSIFSAEVGTVLWSCRVDSLAALEAADDALMASDDFNTFITDRDHLFTGPIEDTVSQVVHGAPTGEPGQYVQVARAVCAHGSLGEGMAMGVELAETAARITGITTMFVTSVAGSYGAVGWLTSVPDLGALETATAALAADADWLKLIDRAGHAYQPGVTSSILRRLS
jgi:hypothetical protein